MAESTTDPAESGIDIAGPSDGAPICCLHGAVFTGKQWTPQRESLTDRYRVIAPDLPGHGARADGDFEMERALDLVDRVLDAETDGSATLVGLSLGGYVATIYAGRNPDKVDGLVLAGCSANPVDKLGTLTGALGKAVALATKSERIANGLRDRAATWVRERDLPREQIEEIVAAGFYPRQFGVAGPELAGRDVRSQFAAYDGPALVCNGEKDLVMRKGASNHVAAAADARSEVIKGSGHVCTLEKPARFTDLVRRFHRQRVAPGPTP